MAGTWLKSQASRGHLTRTRYANHCLLWLIKPVLITYGGPGGRLAKRVAELHQPRDGGRGEVCRARVTHPRRRVVVWFTSLRSLAHSISPELRRPLAAATGGALREEAAADRRGRLSARGRARRTLGAAVPPRLPYRCHQKKEPASEVYVVHRDSEEEVLHHHLPRGWVLCSGAVERREVHGEQGQIQRGGWG